MIDDNSKAIVVKVVTAVCDPRLQIGNAMVTVVLMSVLVIAGAKPLALVVKVAVDLLASGTKVLGLTIFAFCLGAVRLVFEAVLDTIAHAIQVSIDAFALC